MNTFQRVFLCIIMKQTKKYNELKRNELNDFVLMRKLAHVFWICPNLFNALANLGTINFSFNQIKELNSNLFTELFNLKWINFKNNQIEEIHPDLCNRW